jgi:hypothetical protein
MSQRGGEIEESNYDNDDYESVSNSMGGNTHGYSAAANRRKTLATNKP